MDSKEFLESLERLKSTLEGVKSAKEQVEDTVKAYDALHTVMTEYTGKINEVAEKLETLITGLSGQRADLETDYKAAIGNLESTCTGLVGANKLALEAVAKQFQTTCVDAGLTLSTKLDDVSANFSNDITAGIDDFKTRNEAEVSKLDAQLIKFEQQVKQMDLIQTSMKQANDIVVELKNGLDRLGKDIASAEELQDEALDEISKSLSTSQGNQDKALDNILQQVTESGKTTGRISETSVSIKAVVTEVSKSVNSISEFQKTASQNLIRRLQDTKKDLKSDIDDKGSDLGEKLKNISRQASDLAVTIGNINTTIASVKDSVDLVLQALDDVSNDQKKIKQEILEGIDAVESRLKTGMDGAVKGLNERLDVQENKAAFSRRIVYVLLAIVIILSALKLII